MSGTRRYRVSSPTQIHRDLSAEDALESMRVWWTEDPRSPLAVDTAALQDDIDRHAEVPDPDVATLVDLRQYARDVSAITQRHAPTYPRAQLRLRVHVDRP